MRKRVALGVMLLVLCSLLGLGIGDDKELNVDRDVAKCANPESDTAGINTGDNKNTEQECTLECSNDNNSVADSIVELGLRNFESFMDSSTTALVLLYDRMNTQSDEYQMARRTLEIIAKQVPKAVIADERFPRDWNISFGQLDVRQHSELRRIYMEESVTKHFEEVDSRTFMINTPVIRSKFSIFYNYNILDDFDVEQRAFVMASLDHNVDDIQTWLMDKIESILKANDGSEEDALDMAFWSQPNLERKLRSEAELQKKDNSFPFDKNSTATHQAAHVPYFPPSTEDDNDDGIKAFTHSRSPSKMEDASPSEMIAVSSYLGVVMGHYLAWCECYEVLWDENRRKRADEQLNYGPLLEEMNKRVKELLTEGAVPENRALDLRGYFSDMVFGYGRSSKTLEQYVEVEIFEKYGRNMSSIDEIDNDKVALFKRIREFLMAEEEGQDDEDFAEYVSNIVLKLHDILVDFHAKITHNYLGYLRKQDQLNIGADFAFQHPEVFSMSDPAHVDVLSDYLEFEKRTTTVGRPAILSNVTMFLHDDPMQFLLEHCGFRDASHSIKVSRLVGDSRSTEWGGLMDFRLPESIMNEKRLKEDSRKRDRVTLEQFFTLSQQIDNLYLHDFSLRGKCNQLFYEKSPYDAKQFMHLPYVLGGYDLVRKMVRSSCQPFYPVLFVGKKGTNSKMHLDSDETGFVMYLVSGRKRWVTAKNSERPFLYERLTKDSIIPDVLAMNRSERDNVYFDKKYPLLRHSVDQLGVYEFVQEPGQLVWIPPHMAHAVENLEDSVGFSFNTIPRAGVYRSMHYYIHDSQEHSEVDAMLRYLLFEQGDRESFAERTDFFYTTLGEYWAQS